MTKGSDLQVAALENHGVACIVALRHSGRGDNLSPSRLHPCIVARDFAHIHIIPGFPSIMKMGHSPTRLAMATTI